MRLDWEIAKRGWRRYAAYPCATAAGVFTITNPDCARSCLEKGAAPVFISEQAKAIFQVKDYSSVVGDLGYHLEIQATVDEAAKTIAIRNVKRLAYQGASCARPRESAEK